MDVDRYSLQASRHKISPVIAHHSQKAGWVHMNIKLEQGMIFLFFSSTRFSRRKSVVEDCFSGQSPGNAISTPAASASMKNSAKSKPQLRKGGLGVGWSAGAGRV